MVTVALTAFLVGGATMFGGVLGTVIKYKNEKIDGAVLSFAAGIMLAASIAELIVPSLEGSDWVSFLLCLIAMVLGGTVISILERFVTPLSKALSHGVDPQFNAALLFVLAIALHNLPEGIASGVGFGTGDHSKAFTLALGIAIQNIPEGMIVVPPLVGAGVSRIKAMFISILTGVVEVVGTFIGYFAANISETLLPFILCLTGGTMLYIICTDIMTEAHEKAGRKISGYAFLAGCGVMFILGRVC